MPAGRPLSRGVRRNRRGSGREADAFRGLRASRIRASGFATCAVRAMIAAIDRVVQAWREGAGDVVAASYGGSRGHPVVLGRAAWPLVPDEGARALEPTLVPCDDLGSPGGVDFAVELPE